MNRINEYTQCHLDDVFIMLLQHYFVNVVTMLKQRRLFAG